MTALETEDKNIHTYICTEMMLCNKKSVDGSQLRVEKDDKRMPCTKGNEANEINVEK